MLFKAATCKNQNAYYYQLSVALTSSAVSEVSVLHCHYAGVFASIVSVCSALENGRYGNAPIQSDTSTPCVGAPATCNIDQAGGLENAAFMQLVAHADH